MCIYIYEYSEYKGSRLAPLVWVVDSGETEKVLGFILISFLQRSSWGCTGLLTQHGCLVLRQISRTSGPGFKIRRETSPSSGTAGPQTNTAQVLVSSHKCALLTGLRGLFWYSYPCAFFSPVTTCVGTETCGSMDPAMLFWPARQVLSEGYYVSPQQELLSVTDLEAAATTLWQLRGRSNIGEKGCAAFGRVGASPRGLSS